MYKGFIFIFSLLLLASCGGEEEGADVEANGDGTSSVVGNTNPDNTNSGGSNTSTEPDSKIADMDLTTIEYFDLKHDFGNVFYPSDNKFTFKFKNTGSVPLVVDKASASCGCTIPNKPEEPILPGAIGELDVIFRPKSGQVGQNVTKKITVVANTSPQKETYLEISAFVMDAM